VAVDPGELDRRRNLAAGRRAAIALLDGASCLGEAWSDPKLSKAEEQPGASSLTPPTAGPGKQRAQSATRAIAEVRQFAPALAAIVVFVGWSASPGDTLIMRVDREDGQHFRGVGVESRGAQSVWRRTGQ